MTHFFKHPRKNRECNSPLSPSLSFQNMSDSMADPNLNYPGFLNPNSNYTGYFIKNINGYLLYNLPQPDGDWYIWEVDVCIRESEQDTILFQDGESYWSLSWDGVSIEIDALVKFFVERSIDEKDLEDKYKIFVRRSFSSEPDTGPWIPMRPDAGKL